MDHPNVWQFPSATAFPQLAFGMGALCVLLGAVLMWRPPKPNAWAGVRTPWTYADTSIWYASHRAFGWGAIVSAALWPLYIPAAFVLLIVAGVGSLPYSGVRYARKYGTWRTWNAEPGWQGYRPMAKCPGCGHLVKLDSPEELATRPCDECGQGLLRP